jgi:3D (Asp-Asp-Asp) domain-containing protein
MKKLLIILLLFVPVSLLAQTYTVTVYNAVPSQCSGNHLKTADGSTIDPTKVENGTLKWCAVSRDMLKNGFKYGDKIEILSDDPLISGVYEIHDTTSPRLRKHIDLLMPKKINKGKWTGVKIKKVNP